MRVWELEASETGKGSVVEKLEHFCSPSSQQRVPESSRKTSRCSPELPTSVPMCPKGTEARRARGSFPDTPKHCSRPIPSLPSGSGPVGPSGNLAGREMRSQEDPGHTAHPGIFSTPPGRCPIATVKLKNEQNPSLPEPQPQEGDGSVLRPQHPSSSKG